MMDERTEFRLYKTAIDEDLKHMRYVWKDMMHNPDSPLKEAAHNYLRELTKEHERLHDIEMEMAIQSCRDVWNNPRKEGNE